MPGPAAKHPSTRARRNKAAGSATLTLVPKSGKAKTPAMPKHDWHPNTVAWWKRIWSTPMSDEWVDGDEGELIKLLYLEDDFWRAESAHGRLDVMKEIRLQRQCFGLTPLDRRRLQWEIERGDQAGEKTTQRRKARAPKAAAGPDPRALLA